MSHVLKLGPIETEDGPTSVYLSLGESQGARLEDTSDVEALRRLIEADGAAGLVCEPALKDAAVMLGLPVEEPSEEDCFERAVLAAAMWNDVEEGEGLLELLSVLDAFLERAPWEDLTEDEVLKVQLTRPHRTWELRVLGNEAGLELDLCPERGFLAKLIEAEHARDGGVSGSALWDQATVWNLTVERAEPWAEAAFEAWWGDGVPSLSKLVRGEEVPMSNADLALLTAVLDAVLQLVDGQEGKGFAFDGERDVTALVARTQALPAPAPPADPWANVARNAPCPCGSGLKYKKCHEGQQRPEQ